MRPHVFQLNTSPGGVPKLAVRTVAVGTNGLETDSVNHPKVHGGPERAVCLWSLEHILALQEEGHPIFPGAVGENVTVAGLEWGTLVPGTVLELGDEVRIEIASYTTPCRTIEAYFDEGYFKRISQERHPGWSRLYARVLRSGALTVGDAVQVISDRS